MFNVAVKWCAIKTARKHGNQSNCDYSFINSRRPLSTLIWSFVYSSVCVRVYCVQGVLSVESCLGVSGTEGRELFDELKLMWCYRINFFLCHVVAAGAAGCVPWTEWTIIKLRAWLLRRNQSGGITREPKQKAGTRETDRQKYREK